MGGSQTGPVHPFGISFTRENNLNSLNYIGVRVKCHNLFTICSVVFNRFTGDSVTPVKPVTSRVLTLGLRGARGRLATSAPTARHGGSALTQNFGHRVVWRVGLVKRQQRPCVGDHVPFSRGAHGPVEKDRPAVSLMNAVDPVRLNNQRTRIKVCGGAGVFDQLRLCLCRCRPARTVAEARLRGCAGSCCAR